MTVRCVPLLALMACGRTQSLSGVDGGAVLPTPNQSGLWGAGECSLRCEEFKGRLQDDFGVQAPTCWDDAMFTAGSFTACNCLFENRWGVTMIPGGADDCPSGAGPPGK